jgi:hypothetical protein
MKPIGIDDDKWLICPSCEDNYLHHTSLTVYNRREDAKETRVTHLGSQMDGFSGSVNDTVTSATVANKDCDNPSPRRHGLQIKFWCETCNAEPTLNLYQHKGFTGLEWK